LQYIRPGNGFVPNFPMFEKIEVNGDGAHPLFGFLKVKYHFMKCVIYTKKDGYITEA